MEKLNVLLKYIKKTNQNPNQTKKNQTQHTPSPKPNNLYPLGKYLCDGDKNDNIK